MGVGAIFISSLALSKLPAPQDPPADQTELLAAVIPPIISFVVLGSIIIRKDRLTHPQPLELTSYSKSDGLSIPFLSVGKRVHSRTISITQTWTFRSAPNQPDWITSVRRVTSPGNLVSDPFSISAVPGDTTPHQSINIQTPTYPRSIAEVPIAGKALEQLKTARSPQPSPPYYSVQSDGESASPLGGGLALPKVVHFPSLQ
jgi:hypothetical protein